MKEQANTTKDTSKKQIYFAAIISYAAIVISAVISMIFLPWMADKIGKSNYGLYNLANSLISLFLLDFGLSASTARFLAKYRAENDLVSINRIYGLICKLYAYIDIVILAVLSVLYFCIGSIYTGLTAAEIETFKTLYIIVAVYSIVSFPFISLSGVLNAYEKFIQLKLCDLFNRVFSILFAMLALSYKANVAFIVLASSISGIVTILVKLLIIRKTTPVRIDLKYKDNSKLKELFSFSIWITVITIAQRLFFSLAPSILGIVSTSDEIAVFAPAHSLEGYYYTFAAAINGLFLPKISRMIADKREDDIFPLMVKVGKYQFTVMGMILIAFVVMSKDFMLNWMGEEYVNAYYCAILLFIPDLFLFTQQIANTTAVAKNVVKSQAIGYLIAGIICVATTFVFAPSLGAIGSCIGICFAYCYLFIHMNVIYYKKLHLNVFAFFKQCYLRLSMPMLLSLITSWTACYGVNMLMDDLSWQRTIIKGVIVVVIYALCMFTMGLSKNERNRINDTIRKRFKKEGVDDE